LTAKGKYVIHTLEKRIECSQWGPLRRPLLSDVPSKKRKKKKRRSSNCKSIPASDYYMVCTFANQRKTVFTTGNDHGAFYCFKEAGMA